MPDETDQNKLITHAVAGDRMALQRLLLRYSTDLRRHIESKLPQSLRGVTDVDDVVQQVLVLVYTRIGGYEPRPESTFWGWLKTVANNRLRDNIRAAKRLKRGGGFKKAAHAVNQSGSIEQLVNLLSAGSHTPSKSVARHDAVQTVQRVIQELPEDYRQAVQLRFLEGRSLDEVADLMQRSSRSVQGLLDRAKKKMRAELGRLSLYE